MDKVCFKGLLLGYKIDNIPGNCNAILALYYLVLRLNLFLKC
jgi:hypothetical protein